MHNKLIYINRNWSSPFKQTKMGLCGSHHFKHKKMTELSLNESETVQCVVTTEPEQQKREKREKRALCKKCEHRHSKKCSERIYINNPTCNCQAKTLKSDIMMHDVPPIGGVVAGIMLFKKEYTCPSCVKLCDCNEMENIRTESEAIQKHTKYRTIKK